MALLATPGCKAKINSKPWEVHEWSAAFQARCLSGAADGTWDWRGRTSRGARKLAQKFWGHAHFTGTTYSWQFKHNKKTTNKNTQIKCIVYFWIKLPKNRLLSSFARIKFLATTNRSSSSVKSLYICSNIQLLSLCSVIVALKYVSRRLSDEKALTDVEEVIGTLKQRRSSLWTSDSVLLYRSHFIASQMVLTLVTLLTLGSAWWITSTRTPRCLSSESNLKSSLKTDSF